MDRPEPGLIKWSQIPGHDRFIHLNLQRRIIQLYEPTGIAQAGRFDHRLVSKHDDFPALTTYDWSPSVPGLVAVGGQNGGVNLLRVDDDSNDYIELGLKMTRTCQAVAFNSQGLLAVGLDRVRLDQSLHVWDVGRLAATVDSRAVKGFGKDVADFTDPAHRLESSASISSIKFFDDSPQTLILGVKGLGLRSHDLRDHANSTRLQYSTKCNNNLTIDYLDQNYFASSALDQPGVFVWDRRATGRAVASPAYLAAVDDDDVSWGGALCMYDAVAVDDQPSLSDSKHSMVRSLRYCRDRRGHLGVLTRTGQLKVMHTTAEITPPEQQLAGSPELLRLQTSHEMDVHFADPTRRNNERIVSFDWLTMGSPGLQPRLLVLRASGAFEILEQPSYTSDHLYKLSSWKAPYRGLDEGAAYHGLMDFEASQAPAIYGPLLVEQALNGVPLFGEQKADVQAVIEETLHGHLSAADVRTARPLNPSVPPGAVRGKKIGEKLRALREMVIRGGGAASGRGGIAPALARASLSDAGPVSCRELHESLLSVLPRARDLPPDAQADVDNAMLLRAKEKYLFEPSINRSVVSDDLWLRYIWDWIADSEDAAADGGMRMHPLDLTYMGVAAIWENDLGQKPSSRLPEGVTNPEPVVWERCIGSICKKRRLPKYQGVATKRPFHRQLCLDICSWGESTRHEADDSAAATTTTQHSGEYPSSRHTMATARALFRGDMETAVQILKKASADHPELLFLSLALQLIGRGKRLAKESLDFDDAAASKTDPYLRAISSLIATGDWTAVADQRSLPLADRAYVAVRNFDDDRLTRWLRDEVASAAASGDVEGIVLTGITDRLVDVLAAYVGKFGDFQTATLVMSICAPRYVDDRRCLAWRNAYRAYLQRHKAFFLRTKFEVESTKKSKREDQGKPTVKTPSRQIALRCVYCDAETTTPPPPPGAAAGTLAAGAAAAGAGGSGTMTPGGSDRRNPLMAAGANAGISCPNCGRHLPRCIVCLEVVGIPRSDRPEAAEDMDTRRAARFPTFCLKCEHVLHLDHARQWFARHVECPVPECRCRCNARANPELNYH